MTILNFLTGEDKKRKQTNISTDSPISAPKALGKKTLGRAIMNIDLNQKLDYEMLNKGGAVMKKKKTKMMAKGGMAKKSKMYAKGGMAKKKTKMMAKGGKVKKTKMMAKGGKVKKTKMMAKGGKVKGTKMYSKGGKVSKGR